VKSTAYLVLVAANKNAFIAADQGTIDALVAVATEKMSVLGAMEVVKSVALTVVEMEKMMTVIHVIDVMVPEEKIVLLAADEDSRDVMTVLERVMKNVKIALEMVLRIVVFVLEMEKLIAHYVWDQQKLNAINV
jgi:hypothetical protein